LLDGTLRGFIDPILARIGGRLARAGITADALTMVAFGFGLAAGVAIVLGHFLTGMALLLTSRLLDGLDGAVARHTAPTDRGGYLDIVLDFAFYGIIPMAFILADPAANGVAGGFLILTFYINGSSFLAYAIMAEKRGLSTMARGSKSLYFTTGLAEAGETILVFCLFCLFPAAFTWIAIIFGIVCLITAAARILLAWRVLE